MSASRSPPASRPPSRPPTTGDSPDDRLRGVSERIKRFSPAWFSITMGTGIPATLILSSPYPVVAEKLRIPAVIFLLLDTFLFALFFVAMTLRYILFPKIWKATWKHETHSLYIGTFPMSMLTLISGAVSVSQAYGMGESWLRVMAGLWWLSVVVSIIIAFTVPFLAFTSHRNLPQSITSSLLLPVVPMITCAAIGATLSDHLTTIDSLYAFKIWVTSYVCLGPGLILALFYLTLYIQRLTFHHIPTQETILSSFLPLGPTGLGGFSLLKLGSVAVRLLPLVELGSSTANLDGKMAGFALWGAGLGGALLLWGLGIWFMLIAIASFLFRLRNGVAFNNGFWALTFPLASLTLSTLNIAHELDNTGFKVIGTLFTLAVCINVITLLVPTTYAAFRGSRAVFAAPCVDGIRLVQKDEVDGIEIDIHGR